jgi:hypothetical protein
MRSTFTILLIMLIGLAPWAVVLGQPMGGSLPWCTSDPNFSGSIPDPLEAQSAPGGSSAPVATGTTYNRITYSLPQATPICTEVGDGTKPCTYVVDPVTAINSINAARQNESVQLQSATPGTLPLPYLTGMVANASGTAVSIPTPPDPLPNTSPQTLPDYYPQLTQDQKLVVLINLERTARGLSPFSTPIINPTKYAVGSTASTSVNAPYNYGLFSAFGTWILINSLNCESGSSACYNPYYNPYGDLALSWEANNHALVLAEFYQFNNIKNPESGNSLTHDNSVEGLAGNRITAIPGFASSAPIEAETDGQNPETAVFTWLYNDATEWGHRHGLLGVGDSNCLTQIGAGVAPSVNEAAVQGSSFNILNYSQSPPSPPTCRSGPASPVCGQVTVPPPQFFYIAEIAGPESGWQPPVEGNAIPISPAIMTNDVTAAGEKTLSFASLPPTVVPNETVTDVTDLAAIPSATTVGLTSADNNTVTTSQPVANQVGSGDTIIFGFPSYKALQIASDNSTCTSCNVMVTVTYPQAPFGLTNRISSVTVYQNPYWGTAQYGVATTNDLNPNPWDISITNNEYPPNVCPMGPTCPSPLGVIDGGSLGSGGTECTPSSGEASTANPYVCVANVPANTSVVVIARDAFDEYACAQLGSTTAGTDSCGILAATIITEP